MERGDYVWWEDGDKKQRTGQYVRTVERGRDFGKLVIYAPALDKTVKVMPDLATVLKGGSDESLNRI